MMGHCHSGGHRSIGAIFALFGTQYPVADLINIPFQKNFNFGCGLCAKFQYDLSCQPVVPFHITEELKLITRAIVPVLSQPQLTPFGKRGWGIGDVNPTLIFSPAHSAEIVW
jgi:hypothetical protein